MEVGLPAQETCGVSRELSPGLGTEKAQARAGRQGEGTARTNNETGRKGEGLENPLDERPARSRPSLRLGGSGRRDKGRRKRIEGKELPRPEEGVSRASEIAVPLDAFILCKHCGQCIKRNDREVHRGTEHDIAKKTIKCKVLDLNADKARLLESEYANYQRYIRGDKSVPLYSATKQQADRFLKQLKKQNGGVLKQESGRDYPLILRKDVYRAETKYAPYWIGIPVSNARGKLNAPIGIASELPDGAMMNEAKLLKIGGDFYVYMTIERDVIKVHKIPTTIMAVDAGIHNIATTVNSIDRKPRFYGREMRKLRSHFYQLRKKLQVNGAYEAVKKIGNKESRTTDDILHKVSREIVDEAERNNSAIVIGDLKGIRLQKRYSRGFMRKLSSFPFYRLFQFIKYKAQWSGIKVIEVSEAYTSQTCHHCHSKGLRIGGKFKCYVCGHEYNADYNGAYNIMNRGMGQALSQGLILAQPTVRTR